MRSSQGVDAQDAPRLRRQTWGFSLSFRGRPQAKASCFRRSKKSPEARFLRPERFRDESAFS